MKSILNMYGGIAVLNLIDGFLTHVGLTYQYIEESNPLMLVIWEYDRGTLFVVLKIVLSCCIFIIGMCMNAYVQKKSRSIHVLVSIVFFLYLYILCIHITWIHLIFY